MKIVLAICLVASLIVICILHMEIDALSLYIKDMGFTPDLKTISEYSKKAAKKFFKIQNDGE